MAKGKTRRRSRAAIPLIPSIIATLPEITVGIAAAADIEAGKPAGEVGAAALSRLSSLYALAPAQKAQVGSITFSYDAGTNIVAKVGAALVHGVARWGGMRIPLGRRVTLL